MTRLSISHYICPPGYEIDRFLAAAADVGAGAVGLTVRAIEETGIEKLETLLKNYGLAVSSLNSAGYFTHPRNADKKAQSALNQQLIEAASALSADILCVITGGLERAGYDVGSARKRIEAGLDELAGWAAAAGVTLGVEPIHPAEIAAKGCINSIAAAKGLVAVYENVHLIIDHYHSWWDPDLWTIFETSLADVALLQVCAVRPPAETGLFRRGALSDSGLSAADLIRHAEAAGYRGWYEFELFADARDGRDVASLIADAASVLDGLEVSSA